MKSVSCPRQRFLLFAVSTLLIFGSGFGSAIAQVSAPAPSQAQVIAQSVEPVSGGSMKWYLQTEAVPPTDQPPFTATNAFICADTGQVLVTQGSERAELLSPGQATYADPEGAVNAIGTASEDVFILSLVAATVPDGDIATFPFDVAQGTYNVQLTRGVMNAGDKDTFSPVNDYPFLIVVVSGVVQLQEIGTTEVERAEAGDVWEWTHATEITAEENASYLIASIGEKVTLPTGLRAPTVNGAAKMMFYDCPDSVLTSLNPDECTLTTIPVQAMLTSANGKITRATGMNAMEQADHSWVFRNMPAGNWTFKWVIGDGSPAPQVVMSGDALLQGTQWQVVVKPGATATVHVMLVPNADQGIDLNTVNVYFQECPSGWVPGDSLADCGAAETPPNLELTDVMGAGIVFNTDWDAVSTAPGIYVFENIPPQTYFISVAFNDYWTVEKTHLLGGAYSDGFDWYVDVPADDVPVDIYVVLGHIGDGSDPGTNPTGTGQVLITQMECLDMEGSGCVGAESPWEVYLFSDATGEMHVLSIEGTMVGEGQWLMFVPAGGYTVQLPNDAGWYVEYTSWVEVFEGEESYVNVTGYP